MTAADMGVVAAKAARERAGVEPAQVEESIFGNARQAGGGPNVARQISVRSGVPQEVPAYTVNKACASGMKAIALAYQSILLGDANCILAGGTESMSRVPYYLDGARWGYRLGNQEMAGGMYRDGFFCPLAKMVMGETAEVLVEQYRITREEQDEFALASQTRAEEAFAAQVLACDRTLNFNRDRLNVNGGAIAIGHPIGATGTRITVTLLHEMLKRNTKRGVATLCVSGGMGMALALEGVV